MPKCPTHQTELVCMSCLGSLTSAAKAAASRANGKRGGRPKKHKHVAASEYQTIAGWSLIRCMCGAKRRSDRQPIIGGILDKDGWYVAAQA